MPSPDMRPASPQTQRNQPSVSASTDEPNRPLPDGPLRKDAPPEPALPDHALYDALIQNVLQTRFGLNALRPGQREVMGRLLAGRSALAIFPTGGGKSLCYQLPALALEGVTLVVSPLIALMKDQLDFLSQRRIPAARYDSSLSAGEADRVRRQLRDGSLKLLYVSPERLGNERFLGELRRTTISLLAIDEAHCISQWGHNFRPDYLRLARIAGQLGPWQTLALTATATPQVASDIAEAFAIADDDVVRTGFYRPNLDLHITPCTLDTRDQLLVERVQARPGAAIVYVTLQRTAEQVAALLALHGVPAAAYHAGLKLDRRTALQEEFMNSATMVIVATIAFGMGVDKSDVRAVYHYNLPGSIENYMQEIGRAGRDGVCAHCEMLACGDDLFTLRNFSYGDTPTAEAVASLVDELTGGKGLHETFDVSPYDLAQRHDVRELVVKTLLAYLELDDVLEPTGFAFGTYRFTPHRPSAAILERFSGERRELLRAIFREALPVRNGFRLDMAQLTRKLQQPRQRIAAALDYLASQGDLDLQSSNPRCGFRIEHPTDDPAGLTADLVERFEMRERSQLERLDRLVGLIEDSACVTQRLLAYFGEQCPPCGHCSGCADRGSATIEPRRDEIAVDEIDSAVRRAARQQSPALQQPRQVARFLCGIPSPAATQAGLRRHPDFASLTRVSFERVLARAHELLAERRR
ncbi:MAG: RecQ family ATP-dependent DNA helicase [Planctomycetales bacterium]|nr:RecQ family ATP-dependent DNA helicase [Planctomycetales bacterium]